MGARTARRMLLGAVAVAGMALVHTVALAQASAPTNSNVVAPAAPTDTPQSTAGRRAPGQALDDARKVPIKHAAGIDRGSDSPITAGGKPVAEGSRVLRTPGSCAPKTNSLDCVAEDGQAPQGANVSNRVRNSVIGEVGAGRAATEGGGKAKAKEACTPVAGKLTCE